MSTLMKTLATAAALLLSVPALAATPFEQGVLSAHDAYLAAINANDLDAFLATVTDDVVFIAPNAPALEGKDVVGPWVEGYFDAVETAWEKQPVEIVVTGDWAFERYLYRVVDTPRGGGAVQTDTGAGLNIYRRGTDGVWRVARDARVSDKAPATDFADILHASCRGETAPC